MKQFSAIVFSVLLVWMQILPVSAAMSLPPCCHQTTTVKGAGCCDGSGCCEKSPSNSKPAPAVPTQSRTQSALAILAVAVPALTLPANETISSLTSSTSLLQAAASPLYARDCALRL